jgi:hypothetical protein
VIMSKKMDASKLYIPDASKCVEFYKNRHLQNKTRRTQFGGSILGGVKANTSLAVLEMVRIPIVCSLYKIPFKKFAICSHSDNTMNCIYASGWYWVESKRTSYR